jgi:diguanylate cyclase (GGDEF)-like protein
MDSVFSFDAPESQVTAPVADDSPEPLATTGDVVKAMESAGEATYRWIVATDEIFWSSNAKQVLGCSLRDVATGKRYASLLDADNLTSRYETIILSNAQDSGSGVPYAIEYCFKPEGRQGEKAIWLEDEGRWFAGRDGRPSEVFGVVRKINERHVRDQEMSFIGNCDPLTGMMNRGRMAVALGQAISVAQQDASKCAFALAAVNNLPLVNQAYGYEVADEVIVAIGERLREVTRTGDAIARYSGSKFGIILNNCSPKDLPAAVERFLAVVRDSVIETSKGPVWAMLSIGAICLPDHANDTATATARAEEALNEARHMPTDGCVIYAPSESRRNEQLLNARAAAEIVQCLKTDTFKLAFQPIADAKTGEITMYEALLRIIDEAGEVITAGHLVPVAERLGLVRLIDRAVAQMTIAMLHSYPTARISMNISATTATDPRWHGQILEIINGNKQVANRLTIEITETVALNNIEETKSFVIALREAGCSVAIDDFGAGYTSFRNLRDLPIDIIKLDGAFCRDIRSNPDNEYFIRSLIDLAHKFNLKVVAEWVESASDAELLKQWGVDKLQGNYIGAAEVRAPWVNSQGASFELPDSAQRDASEPTPLQSAVLASEKVKETAPTYSVEVLVPAAVTETAEVAKVPEPETSNTQVLELDDVDADIAKLRGTLTLLDKYFRKDKGEAADAA